MKPGFINMTQRWKFSQSSGNPEANLFPKKGRWLDRQWKSCWQFFWDTEGTIMCDFLPTNKTMNGEYYSQLLLKLKQELVTKRPGKLRTWFSVAGQCAVTSLCSFHRYCRQVCIRNLATSGLFARLSALRLLPFPSPEERPQRKTIWWRRWSLQCCNGVV